MTQTTENRGFIGQGTLYMRVIGDESGFVEVGNATELSIQPQSDTKVRTSKRKNNYGAPLDTVIIPKAADVKIKMDSFSRQNLGMMLMGKNFVENLDVLTVADEPVTIMLDGYVKLANKQIDISTVQVKDSLDTVIDSELYMVNDTLGLIMFKSDDANTLINGDTVKVSYKTVNYQGFAILGATESQIKVELMLDGANLVTKKSATLEIYQATLAPTSPFDFYSEDFATLELGGNAEVPDGKDEPYKLSMGI